jgi:GTPase
MPKFDPSFARHCNYRTVAVSKTTATANISTASDGCPGQDYLERVIVIAGSTAAPGAVKVLDGDVQILNHNAQLTAYTGSNVYVYEIGCLSQSTKGFNITTGTSVTALAIGRF